MIMLKSFILLFLLKNVCEGRPSCKAVDLAWPFNNETIFWGDSDGFQLLNQVANEQPNGDWFAVNDFKSSEHGGTHLDAPYHFVKTGWKVGDIPLQNLMANGIMIDLSHESSSDAVLLPKHLIKWERKYGRIPKNGIILVNFNWSSHYHNKTEYMGGTTPSQYRFPGIAADAAEWIVKNRKIVGIGIDTASVDPGDSTDRPSHKIFLSNNIYHLENVKIPTSLSPKHFKLIVMPMYIEEGTGAPVRIVAYTGECWRDN